MQILTQLLLTQSQLEQMQVALQLDQASGALTLTTAADFESGKTSYEVTVTATDNDDTNSTTQDITVTIKDTNDNRPIITSPNVFTVDENQLSVGTVTFTDADGGSNDPDWKAFFIRDGADKDLFEIGFKTGVITFKSAPDYETKSEYNFQVNVSDGTLPETTQQVTVIIRDQNDNAPVFTSSATVTIDENKTAVTTLVTTDADTNPTVTYSITGGADAASFAVTTDGVLTLTTAADYESGKTSYEVTVTATDNDDTNSTPQTITVTIEDVNDNAPVFTMNTLLDIDENTTAVTTLTTTDADTNPTVSYSITGGPDAASFAVNESTGALTLITAADHESGKILYEVIVSANDGVNSTDQGIRLSINDVNDNAPVFTSIATVTIDENTTAVTT